MTDEVEDFLEHFGVKGMKWGRHKAQSGPTAVSVSREPGKKVKARGGTGLSPHEDAVNAAVTKQKAKSSTTDSLSNKELQDLVTRMNLEQQYSRLSTVDRKPVEKFIADTLVNIGKQQLTKIANDQASAQVNNLLKKK